MHATARTAIHRATPTVHALDARGLRVREILYHRAKEGPAESRITGHQHDCQGRQVSSIDPRLRAASALDPTVEPNLIRQFGLSSKILRERSVDAGTSISLYDSSSRIATQWSANGTRCEYHYENASMPGRLLAVLEQSPEQVLRVAERWFWAATDSAVQARNLAGRCERHYDAAGKLSSAGYSLQGAAAEQRRQLLAGDQPGDWPGVDEAIWQKQLEPSTLTSRSLFDALGATLLATDAHGHQQRQAYDVSGQLTASWVRTVDQEDKAVVLTRQYAASGQMLAQVNGNGTVTQYAYAPDTLRLVGIKTCRDKDRKTLQDLHYEHDPAGLIVQMRNDASPTRFWRNQKTSAQSTYTYDSLHQLIKATGRQMAGLGQATIRGVSPHLPAPDDASAYIPYQRDYHYDAAGNLLQIRHRTAEGDSGFTRRFTVSNRSNRTLLADIAATPEEVDLHFERAGQQMTLDRGRRLQWNTRAHLASVTGTPADTERYLYDSTQRRLRKTTAQGIVVYMPGLEIRDSTTQRLDSIRVGEQVRVLHWRSGKPAGIEQDQIRYSIADVQGSTTLELDAEGEVMSQEEYFPFGGTAAWACRSEIEASFKTLRYSGKERDATGLYYYGYRYYQPWAGRWLSADPASTVDGLNLYAMVSNDPIGATDEQGLMFKTVVYGATALGGAAHQIYQHRQKAQQPPAPMPAPSATPGDFRVDAIAAKVHHMQEEHSPGAQIYNSVKGRVDAVDHLLHGKVPGAAAAARGLKTVATVAEFSVSGDVHQIEKVPLAKAATQDAAHNLHKGIVAAAKTVRTGAEVATLSDAKAQELQGAMDDLRDLATDQAVTGVAFGASVKAGLEGAALVMPHPAAKVGLKIASFVWTATGMVHTAEELGKIAEKHKDLMAHQTGTNLVGQMQQINSSNRPQIMNQVRDKMSFPSDAR